MRRKYNHRSFLIFKKLPGPVVLSRFINILCNRQKNKQNMIHQNASVRKYGKLEQTM